MSATGAKEVGYTEGLGRVVELSCVRKNELVERSVRAEEIANSFGVFREEKSVALEPVKVELGPGRIVAFGGPSGSGKSTAIGLIEEKYAHAHNVGRVMFPRGRAVVDAVAPCLSLAFALRILSICALGEVSAWLKTYFELSEGERFRARLARALAAAVSEKGERILIIDEFGSGLHRRVAKAIAFNLRRIAKPSGVCIVLATSSQDLFAELQPDTLVNLHGSGKASVTHSIPKSKPFGLWKRLRIEKACKKDYDEFSHMHYRTGDELGFVDKMFMLREGYRGQPLAIAVYSYPPAELALRNRETGNRFKRNLPLLNREMRILRRLVVHPDLRGCGIGHRFVRRTLPMVGTRFVECLACMGRINPVFERAGMKKVDVCELPKRSRSILEKVRRLGADPMRNEFELQIATRSDVRKLVLQMVENWYRATSAEGSDRPQRQSPKLLARLFRSLAGSRPVYYLWENKNLPVEKASKTKQQPGERNPIGMPVSRVAHSETLLRDKATTQSDREPGNG